MTRFATATLVAALLFTAGAQAQAKKYGAPLTLKETTKVSDIYASPDKYKGKRVQVEGPILDVCTDMGCWIAIGSDQAAQMIRFKVEDGVIVFPTSAKGLTAKVEGVIDVTSVTEGEKTKVNVQIKGEGAEVK